jgi:hypothetical protein
MKKFILLVVVCSSLKAMEQPTSTSSSTNESAISEECAAFIENFNGLTPEEILKQSPKLPAAEEEKIKNWLKNLKVKIGNKTIGVLDALLEGPQLLKQKNGALGANAGQLIQRNNLILKQASLSNKSQWNYILDIPGTKYVLRIAGPINRLWNMISHAGFDQGSKSPKTAADADKIIKDWQKWSKDGQGTYQTISHVAYYQRAQQAKEKCGLSNIIFPETYLFHVPGRPVLLSDNNYVVIQKKVESDPIRMKTNQVEKIVPHNFNKITDAVFEQYLKAILSIRLWDTKANTNVDKDGNIVVSDLEQPNTSDPAKFFGKNSQKEKQNIRGGLLQFAAKKPPKWDSPSIMNLALTDPVSKEHAETLYKKAQGFINANFNVVKKSIDNLNHITKGFELSAH